MLANRRWFLWFEKTDLVWELHSLARKVVWSGTSFSDPDAAASARGKLPSRVWPVGRLEGLDKDGRYIVKGAAGELVTSQDTVDAVIYATGYKFGRRAGRTQVRRIWLCGCADFPFFSESSGLFPSRTMRSPEGAFRESLHLHLFHRKHPSSLFFLGLPEFGPGIFKVMEHQTKAIIAVMKGHVSTEVLLQSGEAHRQAGRQTGRQADRGRDACSLSLSLSLCVCRIWLRWISGVPSPTATWQTTFSPTV